MALKPKKIILFFSAGLGDALLLVPLVKQLKKEGFYICGFFTTQNPCIEIFSEIELLDEVISCTSRKKQLRFALFNYLQYDIAILNYFAVNRSNLLTAAICAKKIIRHLSQQSYPYYFSGNKSTLVAPIPGIHDGEQNIRLWNPELRIKLPDFFLTIPERKKQLLPHPFIVVQMNAGNAAITYKNWPFSHWITFFTFFLKQYPDKKLVLLGDAQQHEELHQFALEHSEHIHSLLGKTSLTEAMHWIEQSHSFIGLDGGLMHLAVALRKPTFSLWGPSSSTLYGYEQLSPLHKCISLNMACSPCNAWIGANLSKTKKPENCPDFSCMNELLPNIVFREYQQYVNLLSGHAA